MNHLQSHPDSLPKYHCTQEKLRKYNHYKGNEWWRIYQQILKRVPFYSFPLRFWQSGKCPEFPVYSFLTKDTTHQDWNRKRMLEHLELNVNPMMYLVMCHFSLIVQRQDGSLLFSNSRNWQ